MNQEEKRAWATQSDGTRTDFEKPKSPVPPTIAAVALWILALAVELAGGYAFSFAEFEGINWILPLLGLIAGIVLSLVLVMIGARYNKVAHARGGGLGTAVSAALSSLGCALMMFFFMFAKNTKPAVKVAAGICGVVSVALVVLLAANIIPGLF